MGLSGLVIDGLANAMPVKKGDGKYVVNLCKLFNFNKNENVQRKQIFYKGELRMFPEIK